MKSFAGKMNGLRYSYPLTRVRTDLQLNPEFQQRLTSLLSSADKHASNAPVTPADEQLCATIHQETIRLNRNNVTRTMAYWELFKRFPELQWAFLAHMVSRNGGWSMTDLKGQWLSHLMDQRLISSVFDMLEACNSLIFGDAYPQLRLYVEGKRMGRNLSHLLPNFHVSSFMTPFWDQFWIDRDPVPLTEALIVNEQQFIQLRVVEDETYQRKVFHSLAFRSQPYMQTNQIVFPLWRDQADRLGKPMRLVGSVLEKFTDLQERIAFGKSLYGILFGYPKVTLRATLFAAHIPHTGSRADYWPHRFVSQQTKKTGNKSDSSDIAAGEDQSAMWLSPSLPQVWPDQPLIPAKEGDWFRNLDVLSHLKAVKLPRIIDMTHEHLFGQYKLQTAVLLERSLMNGASSRRTGRG